MSQTSTGARSRLTAEQRRGAILEAAKRVFGQAGYHEATTMDIASAAGVSAGVDLSLALIARWFGEPLAVQVAENMEWQSAAWRSGQ